MPLLSATVPKIFDFQLPIGDLQLQYQVVSNRQLAIKNRQCFGWAEGSRTLTGRSHSAVLCRLELRPTQKGDKELSVTRHLADVVTFGIRPELAGTARLELANQLIENQPAFHFAFIPVIVWCALMHCRFSIADCQ